MKSKGRDVVQLQQFGLLSLAQMNKSLTWLREMPLLSYFYQLFKNLYLRTGRLDDLNNWWKKDAGVSFPEVQVFSKRHFIRFSVDCNFCNILRHYLSSQFIELLHNARDKLRGSFALALNSSAVISPETNASSSSSACLSLSVCRSKLFFFFIQQVGAFQDKVGGPPGGIPAGFPLFLHYKVFSRQKCVRIFVFLCS